MNYKRIYETLIERARDRSLKIYTESHHVKPRCLGGSNDKSNLVELTPEEHYLAHQLLVRIYPYNSGLVLAAHMMTTGRPSNKLYGWLRRRHSKAMSEMQSGERNSQFGKVWVYKVETGEVKKIHKYEQIPNGWVLGRAPKITEKLNICEFCGVDYTATGRAVLCSTKCLQYRRSPAIYTIDKNIESILEKFSTCGSITKVLTSLGIPCRQGNSYLSSILKERGFKVLKRRNSQ